MRYPTTGGYALEFPGLRLVDIPRRQSVADPNHLSYAWSTETPNVFGETTQFTYTPPTVSNADGFPAIGSTGVQPGAGLLTTSSTNVWGRVQQIDFDITVFDFPANTGRSDQADHWPVNHR